MDFQKIVNEKLSLLINSNVPLNDKNWFQTGGNARFYAEPSAEVECKELIDFAHNAHLPLFILGQGANILISDDGFDGLVIKPCMRNLSHHLLDDATATVTAGAGTTIDSLIKYCLSNNLLGLEEFSGIPGTIGGAVYINVHYFEFLLEHFLVTAHVLEIEENRVLSVTHEWFRFGYNQSTLLSHKYILIDATFKLKRCTDLQRAYAEGKRDEIIRHREKRYPSTHTCGSFFRNFYKNELVSPNHINTITSVAYYLDKVGLKGTLTYGGAKVSHQHANMIVNYSNATSSDIIYVARFMQTRVYETFGIIPQPECQLIGFTSYPLL